MPSKKTIGYVWFALLLGVVCACSQNNYSYIARKWHNLNARDNAYFLAREKMKEVDAQIWKSNTDDYNKILKVYPNVDKNIQTAIAGGIDDIIKKAALPVTRHKNSIWVDDSYNLIGKCRLRIRCRSWSLPGASSPAESSCRGRWTHRCRS